MLKQLKNWLNKKLRFTAQICTFSLFLFYLSIYLSICLSFHPCIYLYLSNYLSVYLSIFLSIYLSIYFSHLSAPRPTFGHWERGSLTHPKLITVLFLVRPKGHWEPCNSCAPRPGQSISGDLNWVPSNSECNTLSQCPTLPLTFCSWIWLDDVMYVFT